MVVLNKVQKQHFTYKGKDGPQQMSQHSCKLPLLFTGSTACNAKQQYISYSESDFEVFAPQGQHVALMG